MLSYLGNIKVSIKLYDMCFPTLHAAMSQMLNLAQVISSPFNSRVCWTEPTKSENILPKVGEIGTEFGVILVISFWRNESTFVHV